MDCPVCQTPMIKSKVGWLCAGCGNLVEPAHHHHAKAAEPTKKLVVKSKAEAKKPSPKAKTTASSTSRPSIVTDVKVRTRPKSSPQT